LPNLASETREASHHLFAKSTICDCGAVAVSSSCGGIVASVGRNRGAGQAAPDSGKSALKAFIEMRRQHLIHAYMLAF